MVNLIGWATTLIFLIGVIFIIIKMKEDEEDNYWLKIIGYYLLGAFRFSFNKLNIPLGFLIYLAFFQKTEKNRRGKKYAAALGLTAFVVALAVPAVSESYYERTRVLKPASTNVYEIDFQDHWNQVATILELDSYSKDTAKLEGLMIGYEKDGNIKSLRYELIWQENGQLRHASIDFHESQKKFMIRALKISEWVQYNRLISPDRLFEKLDNINIKELAPPLDYAYSSLSLGEWSSFAAQDGDIYIIKDGKVEEYKGKLPVQCYWIKTFGMKQSGASSYSSGRGNYYIFDVID
jgi:hypothetical protein